MRAVFVVVADGFSEQSFQMAFVHGNDVIQQVSPAALRPTFCHNVLPRAFEGGPYGPHLQGSDCRGNFQSILPITIEDQEPRSRPERERFPQLLNGP
jgi:hypothetical protein